jgi:hypothetical protein
MHFCFHFYSTGSSILPRFYKYVVVPTASATSPKLLLCSKPSSSYLKYQQGKNRYLVLSTKQSAPSITECTSVYACNGSLLNPITAKMLTNEVK